jgi:hypothetical protein
VLHTKSEGEPEIRAAHLKRKKVYNYIPWNVEDEYSRVLFEEYKKLSVKTKKTISLLV